MRAGRATALLVAVLLAIGAAACSGDDDDAGGPAAGRDTTDEGTPMTDVDRLAEAYVAG